MSEPAESTSGGRERIARPRDAAPERYAIIRRVTLVGAAVDLSLALVKVGGGIVAQSQSLVADGVHSISDLVTDLLVLLAARFARGKPDADHPYGHERIETVATVALGMVLIVVGAGIAIDAVRRLFHPEELKIPAWWAMAIAAVSVALKEAVYHYTMRAARRHRSRLLEANAWHARSDAASSIVVMVGVGGSLLGLAYLDAIAAVVVSWMIVRMGYRLARRSVEELIDTGLDPEQVEAIRGALMAVDGVRDLHMLRTRQMGPKSLVDVHILLDDPKLSVSEGHQISETARAELIREFRDIEDVTVHIDPEDDEEVAQGRHLGLRGEVEGKLRAAWSEVPEAASIRRITLHYLDGRIQVEIELPLDLALGGESPEPIRRRFEQALRGEPDVSAVRVLFG
ncbi:MAG: cation diffusion facilitator family transporter [Immundisolibacterales bacterium]|nr:cation diffusion facilitator family transporter [Immundisolibacterales bacterium]